MKTIPWYLEDSFLDTLFDLLPARYVGPVLLAISRVFHAGDVRLKHVSGEGCNALEAGGFIAGYAER